MTFWQRIVNTFKTAFGAAVSSAGEIVVQEIGQIPAVQDEIQRQIDMRVKDFTIKALGIGLLVIVAILLFKDKK